jgi:hypothetical protein
VDWTWHRHQAGAGLWGSAPPSPSEIRKNIFDNYNVIRVNATRRATPTAPPTGSHRSSALLPLASAARASRGVASPRPPHQECKAKPCPTLSSPNGELLGWHAVPTLPRDKEDSTWCCPYPLQTNGELLELRVHRVLRTVKATPDLLVQGTRHIGMVAEFLEEGSVTSMSFLTLPNRLAELGV